MRLVDRRRLRDSGTLRLWRPGEMPLARALAGPVRALVEMPADLGRELELSADVSGRAGLFASFSVRTAWQLPVARLVVVELARRVRLTAELRLRIETALHEAVMNAVVHGGLELRSELRTDLAALAKLEQHIADRFAGSRRGERRVRVAVSLTPAWVDLGIGDDGRGRHVRFPGPGASHATRSATRKSGRGLGILAAMADEVQLGRAPFRVRLSFRRR